MPRQNEPEYELLMVGMSAISYRIGNIVKKQCRVFADDEAITAHNLEACKTEAEVYMILGRHSRIVNCVSIGPDKNYIELEYYPHGNMKDYLKSCQASVNMTELKRWGIQMIESVVYLHSKEVIHSDLRLDQWFIDSELNLRLGDFNGAGFSEQFELGLKARRCQGLETFTHFLPRDPETDNTVISDMFALGSALYELETGKKPYEGLSDESIETLFRMRKFPATEHLLFGDSIRGCWEQRFTSASQILENRCPGADCMEDEHPIASIPAPA